MNPSYFRLTAEFEVLTPMFLGGADQNQAELRAPSIKGALRFWYRALDPQYRKYEHRIFGSGGEKASRSLLLLRVREGERSGERMVFGDAKAEQFTEGSKTHAINGLIYLGYSFNLGDNRQRRALVPGARFTVTMSCHHASVHDKEEFKRALRTALASLWALGHFGALGSRSRRGFGALALTGWSLVDQERKPLSSADFDALPLLAGEPSPVAWMAGVKKARAMFRTWFGAFDGDGARRARHPHVTMGSEFFVKKEAFRRDWKGALLAIGKELQKFRQRKPIEDYQSVKDHVLYRARKGGRQIRHLPGRVVFGLPLMFRFSSVPEGRPVTFAPVASERHGSLLFIRPVLVNGQLHNMIIRLAGDIPGVDVEAGIRKEEGSLGSPRNNLMDVFVTEQKSKG
ncbi:MAG: type III-B CRISPR module RAMP protein Cmr1 [Byssovorax sp.]